MSDKATEIVLQRVQNAKLSRDFAMATRLLRQALEKNPGDVELWSELGNCYVKAGLDSKAIEPFNQVLSLDGSNIHALNELGGIYRRIGEFDKSIAVLEKGLMISTDTAQINYNLGHTYKLAGRYDAAEECFNEVLEVNPNDVLAINHIGSIQALRGNHTRALQSYWRALQIDPNHPILHLNSARSYQALGKEQEAKLSYENALKSKPGWEDAMNGYAELLMHSKDLSKCDSILEQAIKINPNSPELHSSKGNLSVKQGKYNTAEDSYETALDIDGDNMSALNGLELLYEKQGRNAEAMKKIQRMEELAPGNLEYELRYCKLLIDQKRLEEAGEKLRGMYKTNLNNTDYLNMLAQYFVRSGHLDKANGCFQRISELEPSNITYMRDSAWQFLLNQQYEEAAANLDRYLDKHENDSVALTLRGDVYEKQGNPEEALAMYKKALEYDENNPIILASVQRVGNDNTEKAEITALMTDILSENAKNGDAESIQRSLSLYENSVQNRMSEPLMAPVPISDELAAEIESLETIDYDQLLQFEVEPDAAPVDPFENLVFDVQPDEFLRPIDEEVYSKTLKDERGDFGLIDDDMPTEYVPTRDGKLDYDPYAEGSHQNYDPEEAYSTLDVNGSGYQDDDTVMEQIPPEPVARPYTPPSPYPYQTAPVYQNPEPAAPAPVPTAQPVTPAPAAPETEMKDEPQKEMEPADNTAEFSEPILNDDEDEAGFTTEEIPEEFEEDEIIEVEPSDNDILSAGDEASDNGQNDVQDNDDMNHENIFDDILNDDDEFPGDRDTSEDAIPTVDDLIADPLDDDELYELTEVPTISDVIGDEGDGDLEESEVPDAFAASDASSEPDISDVFAAPTEPQEFSNGFDDGSETLSLDELANVASLASDNPDPEARTCETVGTVLQKIVFKSEERPEFKTAADMFSALRDLSEWLPKEKNDVFTHSLNRLKLDYVIARLNGRPGLLAAATAIRETGGIIPEKPARTPSLLKTMEYMRSLTGMLPDSAQSEAMQYQLDRVTDYFQTKETQDWQ